MCVRLKRSLGILCVFIASFVFAGVSQANDSSIGSSFAAEAYWLAGIDIYLPISRSADAQLFQGGSLQGKGQFDEKDVDLGASLYRFWGP